MQKNNQKTYVKRTDLDQLVSTDKDGAAVISKLVNTDDLNVAHTEMFSSLSGQKTSTDSYDATQDFLKIFPDQELACEIMIALTLTPKDVNKLDLSYSLKNTGLPHQIVNAIATMVKERAESIYDIKGVVRDAMREAYYGHGAYAQIVFPESRIDKIINGPTDNLETFTTEALNIVLDKNTGCSAPLGILGSEKKTSELSIESMYSITTQAASNAILFGNGSQPAHKNEFHGLEFTDNYMLLQLPTIMEKKSTLSIEGIIQSNVMEGISKLKEYDKEEKIVLDMSDKLRQTIGAAIVISLDVRSLSIVHSPGDPTDHIGYLVPIDDSGHPVIINSASGKNADKEIGKALKKNTIGTGLLTKAKKSIDKMNSIKEKRNTLTEWYGNHIIDSAQRRLFNGVYGRELDISSTQRLFSVLLARAFKEKNTRLLYVPKEMISYFAIEYGNDGKGVNTLEKLNILNSMRATLMYSMLSSEVHNNIPHTGVKLTIDPDDPDIDKTSNMALEEIRKVRQYGLPLGLHNPTDHINWIQTVGIKISYDTHPGLPQVKFEFSDESVDRKSIEKDSELWTDMRKQALMGIGPPPSLVDDSYDTEYASIAENSRLVLAKRLHRDRELVDTFLDGHIRLLMTSDGQVIENTIDILGGENISKYLTDQQKQLYSKDKTKFLHEFAVQKLHQVSVKLPQFDTNTTENMATEFQAQSDAIDLALEATISEDMLSNELGGDASDYADTVSIAVKGLLLRNWMAENNFLPELSDLFVKDVGDNFKINLGATLGDHVSRLLEATSDFMAEVKKPRKKANKKIEKSLEEDDDDIVEVTPPDDDGGEVTPGEEPDGIEEDEFNI